MINQSINITDYMFKTKITSDTYTDFELINKFCNDFMSNNYKVILFIIIIYLLIEFFSFIGLFKNDIYINVIKGYYRFLIIPFSFLSYTIFINYNIISDDLLLVLKISFLIIIALLIYLNRKIIKKFLEMMTK